MGKRKNAERKTRNAEAARTMVHGPLPGSTMRRDSSSAISLTLRSERASLVSAMEGFSISIGGRLGRELRRSIRRRSLARLRRSNLRAMRG